VDSGGPKEPCILDRSRSLHAYRGKFEGEKGPSQDMPGHVRRSIYSERLRKGSTDTVRMPIDGCILVPPGEYDRTVVFGGDAVTLTNNCLLSMTLRSSSCSNTNSNKWSKNFDERPHRMGMFHWDNLM